MVEIFTELGQQILTNNRQDLSNLGEDSLRPDVIYLSDAANIQKPRTKEKSGSSCCSRS